MTAIADCATLTARVCTSRILLNRKAHTRLHADTQIHRLRQKKTRAMFSQLCRRGVSAAAPLGMPLRVPLSSASLRTASLCTAATPPTPAAPVSPTARTGQKVLRRKRIGHRVAAWYPPKLATVLGDGVHEVLQVDPSYVLKREKRAARARKGKGPQKKGESRRKK